MHYELTGGNISNVIHYAGLLAIERKKKLIEKEILVSADGNECSEYLTEEKEKLVFYLEDVLDGIKREMIKEGKPFQV